MTKHSEPKTIRRYLNHIARWLRFMPQKDRDELRRELRLHLQSLVLTVQASGVSQDEAIQIALHRFGNADVVGRNIFLNRLKENGVSDVFVLSAKRLRNWAKSTPPVDLYLFLLSSAFLIILQILSWVPAIFCSAMTGILAGRLIATGRMSLSPLVKWTHVGPFHWKQINWGDFLVQFLFTGFIVLLLTGISPHLFSGMKIWICLELAQLVSTISEAIVRNRMARLLAISK